MAERPPWWKAPLRRTYALLESDSGPQGCHDADVGDRQGNTKLGQWIKASAHPAPAALARMAEPRLVALTILSFTAILLDPLC
jgi:hypothetical protein